MSANHTPAPWHVEFRQNYGGTKSAEHIVSENGDLICEGIHWNKNGEADAQLIAAAPELLEALEEVLLTEGRGLDCWERDTFNKARAAVAKATGKDATPR